MAILAFTFGEGTRLVVMRKGWVIKLSGERKVECRSYLQTVTGALPYQVKRM